MPVFPLVGSTMVPPGCRAPLASAASTIRTAMRSFTEPPGLRYSSLANTRGASGPRSRVTELSRTSGVLPTRSTTDSAYCTGPPRTAPTVGVRTAIPSDGRREGLLAAEERVGRGCRHDLTGRNAHPRPQRTGRLLAGTRLHGDEPELRAGRPERVDRHDPPGDRPRRHVP